VDEKKEKESMEWVEAPPNIFPKSAPMVGYSDHWHLWLYTCVQVCLHFKRKTAWHINTKPCTHILYGSCLAGIYPEVKRSKVTWLWKPSWSHVC